MLLLLANVGTLTQGERERADESRVESRPNNKKKKKEGSTQMTFPWKGLIIFIFRLFSSLHSPFALAANVCTDIIRAGPRSRIVLADMVRFLLLFLLLSRSIISFPTAAVVPLLS